MRKRGDQNARRASCDQRLGDSPGHGLLSFGQSEAPGAAHIVKSDALVRSRGVVAEIDDIGAIDIDHADRQRLEFVTKTLRRLKDRSFKTRAEIKRGDALWVERVQEPLIPLYAAAPNRS